MIDELTAVPGTGIDVFGEESLVAPFDDYRLIRDAGPVVYLRRADVYAIGRFADVQAALRASDILVSGEGVGFSETFNAPKGLNVIQSDGELHRRLRSSVARPLSPSRLKGMRASLKQMMKARIATLQGHGRFDAMEVLAPFLPVQAVSHLVGLPEAGRERMLEWAAAAFNLVGPERFDADLASLLDARRFMAALDQSSVAEGSWAAALFDAVGEGRLALVEAKAAISAYVIPSLDTTILAKGSLLFDLCRNLDQWKLLRNRPELVPAAVSESVRRRSVIRWFSRVANADYRVGDTVVPRGGRVMLLYGSANLDERRYEDPERFDLTRDARDQLCWGTGPHMCAGMHLARMEMEVLLEALIEADAGLSCGNPVVGVNRGLYGFASLPMTID